MTFSKEQKKKFRDTMKKKLEKEGVKNEWMEKHLIIDFLDLEEKDLQECKNQHTET